MAHQQPKQPIRVAPRTTLKHLLEDPERVPANILKRPLDLPPMRNIKGDRPR
jgi:hypothetical protein